MAILVARSAVRRILTTFRWLVNNRDLLAWDRDFWIMYTSERAKNEFNLGRLCGKRMTQVPEAPRTSARAATLLRAITDWLQTHRPPDEPPQNGWERWMVETAGGAVVPPPSDACRDLLFALDASAG
jgi:hypothetical protein